METNRWKFLIQIFTGYFVLLICTGEEQHNLSGLSGVISSSEVQGNGTGVIWHLELSHDICQIDLKIQNLSSTDDCHYVGISAGNDYMKGTKTLLVTSSSVGRWVRVANREAIIVPVSNSSISYEFLYNCSTDIIDGENMTEIDIPPEIPSNVTTSICLNQLSNNTAFDFINNVNNVRNEFLANLAEAAKQNCKVLLPDFDGRFENGELMPCEALKFEAHLNFPLYAHKECPYAERKFDWTQNFCICFNVSISYTNPETGQEDFIKTDKLEDFFKEMPNINGTDWNFNIMLPTAFDTVPYIATGVTIFVISLGSFFFIYLKCYNLNNKAKLSALVKESATPKTSVNFEVKMEPATMQNVIYDPNYDDTYHETLCPPTIPEEEEEGGVDNPAFVNDFSLAVRNNPRTLRGPLPLPVHDGSQRNRQQLITFVDVDDKQLDSSSSCSFHNNEYAQLEDMMDEDSETKL